MRPILHILITIAFAVLSTSAIYANANEILPQNLPGDSLLRSKPEDSLSIAPKKVCSCRLMEVKSGKYDSQLVGFFAEKTLQGKKSVNYKILNEYIRREKEYFKFVFLESLKPKESFKTTNDCYSLYRELKAKHKNLKFYNIIDVDQLTTVAKK